MYCAHRERQVLTHSFPTRRSSDLGSAERWALPACVSKAIRVRVNSSSDAMLRAQIIDWRTAQSSLSAATCMSMTRAQRCAAERSEEHTSELQSLMRISYAVFCLKKNKKEYIQHPKTRCTHT